MNTVAATEPKLEEIDQELSALNARERVERAVALWGDGLVMSTSFGVQAAVTLHLVTQVKPDIPVVFVDTGYLFPETYRFARDLTEKLDLNLIKYHPRISPAEQEALEGKLWEQDAEALQRYNFVRKVEPMNRALSDLGSTAWIAGLRRVQSKSRSDLGFVQKQNRIVKVHPILDWNDRDVYTYLQRHDLSYHPLWESGYASVGDWHSSRPLELGMTEEETRFNGTRRECGLHELSGRIDFQI